MENPELTLSGLNKTWILDLDGTLVKHNGYLIDGFDTLLPHTKDFIENIPESDTIIILTARKQEYRDSTISFLKDNDIRYNNIIFGMPTGERILINDNKPSGLEMSHSVNLQRNSGPDIKIRIDKNL